MKKHIIILAFITAVMLFISCNKTAGSGASHTINIEQPSHAAVESNITKPGFALRVNTGFYILDGEDNGDASTKTKWSAYLSLGENVITGQTRRMTFNNTVYDFIEVRRDTNSEGYALKNQIAVGGRLGVVVEEKAVLYDSPKLVSATNATISRRTVLVYYPETEKDGFVEVQGIEGEGSNFLIPKDRYMYRLSLSESNSDIQASILLQTAKTMTNANQTVARDALLKSALNNFSDSTFAYEIQSYIREISGDTDADSGYDYY
jgi:hypothetical protein